MDEKYLKSRVYYNKLNGEILCFTEEQFNVNGVHIPTLQDDKDKYTILKNIEDDNLGMVELEFGESYNILSKSKSYKIDIKKSNPSLDVIYYSDDELKERYSQCCIEPTKELITLNNRISDISQYLFDQTDETISIFENYILQTELTKIMEGTN